MSPKDLPLLNLALDRLYEALNILAEIDGTIRITKDIANGTNELERRIVEMEEPNDRF
jgi:hypothetical protein